MSGLMRRCDGPECPHCGCQDARILQAPRPGESWFGAGKARCNHCRAMFSFRELPAIAAEPEPIESEVEEPIMQTLEIERRVVTIPRCPDCGGETKISSTRKTVRWHKCVDCGKTVKTAR